VKNPYGFMGAEYARITSWILLILETKKVNSPPRCLNIAQLGKQEEQVHSFFLLDVNRKNFLSKRIEHSYWFVIICSLPSTKDIDEIIFKETKSSRIYLLLILVCK